MYEDHQAAIPVGFCPVCGGEIYGPGGCLRCQARSEAQVIAEQEEQIQFIRDTIEGEHLTYIWLSNQIMRTSGVKTYRSEMSEVLSGSRTGPKADEIISAAMGICTDYWRVFS